MEKLFKNKAWDQSHIQVLFATTSTFYESIREQYLRKWEKYSIPNGHQNIDIIMTNIRLNLDITSEKLTVIPKPNKIYKIDRSYSTFL